MNQVKERPILFSGDMVRALRAGTKMQTRRVVTPQPQQDNGFWNWNLVAAKPGELTTGRYLAEWPDEAAFRKQLARAFCPYGQPGDRLWVREAFRFDDFDGSVGMMHGRQKPWQYQPHDKAKLFPGDYLYRADEKYPDLTRGWKPSIHMPRAASRLLLEITAVRVERLQDISEEDAQQEGLLSKHFEGIGTCYSPNGVGPWRKAAAEAYGYLWESINGLGSWEHNPWVWAISFAGVQ